MLIRSQRLQAHLLDASRFIFGFLVPALAFYAMYFALVEDRNEAVASVSPKSSISGEFLSPAERHCMILTILGEATPNSRAEVIGIARNILRRKAMKRWGNSVCSVTLSPRQYSVWNDRSMKRYKYNKKQYQKYSMWVSEALSRGPSRHDHYWHPKTMKTLYGFSNPRWSKKCVVKERIGHAIFCQVASSRKSSSRISKRRGRRHA